MTSRWLPLVSILTLGLLALPPGVEPQPAARVARLGLLAGGSPPPPGQQSRYVRALAEFGWVEGQNLTVVRRDAHGQVERLPALATELVREGVDVILAAIMSYAASPSDQIRRAARYADRIFRGARPADLPVEQPTKYEVVINLKTARALGLVIPPVVQAQAETIER